MSLWSLWIRLARLLLITVLPAAGLGWLLGSRPGAIVAAGLVLGLLLLGALVCERGILRAYRVRPEPPESVRKSMRRVLAALSLPEEAAPQVRAFNDPSPQALVVRGLGGPGAILVSEGLLGSLTEEELRGLLRAAVLRLKGRGIVFQSLCAWIAHRIFEAAPAAWTGLFFGELRWHEDLGVLGALRFVTLLSVARRFSRLGRAGAVVAAHDLPRLPRVSGELINPGSSLLHFGNPWAARSLYGL